MDYEELVAQELGLGVKVPVLRHVVLLWRKYLDPPKNWNRVEIKKLARIAPCYAADVKEDDKQYLFVQLGGGKAAVEFFTLPGQVVLYCPECDASELILHKESPWCLAYPKTHASNCTRNPSEIFDDPFLIRGLSWIILGRVHSAEQENKNARA